MRAARHLLPLLLIALPCCTSSAERAQQQEQRHFAACAQAGYQPKTPAFDDCVLELQSQESQRVKDRVDAIDGLQQVESNRRHSAP